MTSRRLIPHQQPGLLLQNRNISAPVHATAAMPARKAVMQPERYIQLHLKREVMEAKQFHPRVTARLSGQVPAQAQAQEADPIQLLQVQAAGVAVRAHPNHIVHLLSVPAVVPHVQAEAVPVAEVVLPVQVAEAAAIAEEAVVRTALAVEVVHAAVAGKNP
jgi:hypothetical protein